MALLASCWIKIQFIIASVANAIAAAFIHQSASMALACSICLWVSKAASITYTILACNIWVCTSYFGLTFRSPCIYSLCTYSVAHSESVFYHISRTGAVLTWSCWWYTISDVCARGNVSNIRRIGA